MKECPTCGGPLKYYHETARSGGRTRVFCKHCSPEKPLMIIERKRETRGAPLNNRNAAGPRGRKSYYPQALWGKRWSMTDGKKIKAGLARTGESQGSYIDKQVERDFLNETIEHSDV